MINIKIFNSTQTWWVAVNVLNKQYKKKTN